MKRKRTQTTCRCAAYTFPHRAKGGKCCNNGSWPFYCESCLAPNPGDIIDEGIGSYEYWGARGTHHDYQLASTCCSADLIWYKDNQPVSRKEWEEFHSPY